MHIPNCAWPQGQGIGLEGPGPQGPGRPMSGYPDILLVSNQISFESSWATPENLS